MPDVNTTFFETTQCRTVSGLDDGKRKTKRGWSPGDSLNLVRVLSVRVNYSQQCRNDINGRWEYSKSIMEYFNFNRFLSVQIKMILVYKKYIFCEEMSSVLTPWWPIYPWLHAIRCPFLYMIHSEKNLNLFATNRCNKMCVCVRLLELLHWWHAF